MLFSRDGAFTAGKECPDHQRCRHGMNARHACCEPEVRAAGISSVYPRACQKSLERTCGMASSTIWKQGERSRHSPPAADNPLSAPPYADRSGTGRQHLQRTHGNCGNHAPRAAKRKRTFRGSLASSGPHGDGPPFADGVCLCLTRRNTCWSWAVCGTAPAKPCFF